MVELKRFDYKGIVAVLLLLLCAYMIIKVYIEYKNDKEKCMFSPFTYGASKLQEHRENYVHGSITIEGEGNMYFNSTAIIPGEKYSKWGLA